MDIIYVLLICVNVVFGLIYVKNRYDYLRILAFCGKIIT